MKQRGLPPRPGQEPRAATATGALTKDYRARRSGYKVEAQRPGGRGDKQGGRA